MAPPGCEGLAMLRTMRILCGVVYVLSVAFASYHVANAALDPDLGGISGKVVSPNGVPIAGVAISISGRLSAKTVSGADGSFLLSPIPIGVYRMVASKEGYNSATLSDLAVVGPNTAVTVTLTAIKSLGRVVIHATTGVNLSPA